MAQVIALTSSRGQSGKDTLVEELINQGYKVRRVAFADPMKDELCELLPNHTWNYRVMCDGERKDSTLSSLSINRLPITEYSEWLRFVFPNDLYRDRSLRWHLQQFGTDFTRVFKEDHYKWLHLGLDAVTKAVTCDAYDYVVVTDMRETFEHKYLTRFFNATTVRIARDWENTQVDSLETHSSDTALWDVPLDLTLINRLNERHLLPNQLLEYLQNV
jgi:hypothetical protein